MQILTYSNSDKQSQMLDLLKYGTVMAFVDSRHGDVIVPDYLKNDYQLRLNFDYAFEIDDFRVLPDRIEASLSFNRKNFFCVIPFKAVYLFLSQATQRGALFIESVPLEMLETFANMEKQDQSRAQKLKAVPKPKGDTVASTSPIEAPVPANPASQQNVTQAPPPPSGKTVEPAAEKPSRKRGHLRVVK